MAPDIQPVPEGYPTMSAYIAVQNASEAIEFYKRAFGAEELMRLDEPDGKVAHAELGLGDSVLMLADETPASMGSSPQTLGGVTATFSLYVPDVDQAFERAIAAGGTVERPVQDQFYGDRVGTLRDPFGHYWSLQTHIEDVSAEEMQRRMQELAPPQ